MAYSERQQQIEHILLAEKKVDVSDLVRRLGASEVAIRRDLGDMETRGFCLRTASGAILAERPDHVVPYIRKARQYLAEKEAIAAVAAARVSDDEHIILDAGSTTLELARKLRGRNIHVLTNSLPAADILSDSEPVRLTVIGGTLRRASLGLVGPLAVMTVHGIHADKVFLGAAGFDLENGFSSANLIESQTKAALLGAAEEVIIIADSTKFERPAFAPFAPLDRIKVVITDRQPSSEVAKALAGAGVELVVARSTEEVGGGGFHPPGPVIEG